VPFDLESDLGQLHELRLGQAGISRRDSSTSRKTTPTPLGSGTYSWAFEAIRLLVTAGPILLSQYSSRHFTETTAWPRPQLALME